MIRRLTSPLALLLLAAACSSGGSSPSSPGTTVATVPTATTLPPSGTVKLSDGVTYTVVAPGTTLKLDNITLRIDRLRWLKHVDVTFNPPGTRLYAVFTVTITNLSGGDVTLAPTQIWLRNSANRPFLAAGLAGQTGLPRALMGAKLLAGAPVTGTLVFPLPGKLSGGLLVYRLGDLPATAKHVGIARYS